MTSAVITPGHVQAAAIVLVGYVASEHYRLLEVLLDPSRYGSIAGRLFLWSIMTYAMAFTYCVTDLAHRAAQYDAGYLCHHAQNPSSDASLPPGSPTGSEEFPFDGCPMRGTSPAAPARRGQLTRRVSVLDYREQKSTLNVQFNKLQRRKSTIFEVVKDTDCDLINCRTLSLNIYIPLILGHASMFVWVAYTLATFPIYGLVSVPLMLLVYAALMNLNSLLREFVAHPIHRWVWVLALYSALYFWRVRELEKPPAAFPANDAMSLLLVLVGVLLCAFYAMFVAGCALQCALKRRTLKDLLPNRLLRRQH